MSTIKDAKAARLDMDKQLHEAIDNWNPRRPRRWLAKHGNWPAEGNSMLEERYRALRHEARNRLFRPAVASAGGLPSHTIHLGQ